jgi:hypothetical protein
MVYLLNMVIFYSYVKLPEGNQKHNESTLKHQEAKEETWRNQKTLVVHATHHFLRHGEGKGTSWVWFVVWLKRINELMYEYVYCIHTYIYIGMILDTNVLIVPLKMRFLPDSQRWPWRQIFFTASESAWSLMDCNHGRADLRVQSVLSCRHSGNSGRLPKNTGEVRK